MMLYIFLCRSTFIVYVPHVLGWSIPFFRHCRINYEIPFWMWWNMFKMMYINHVQIRCVSLIAVLCCFYCHFTQAAFPLERDVRELVGISQPKRWIVFLDKRATRCLNDVMTKSPTSLMYALRCMLSKETRERCLVRLFRRPCLLIQKYPNILKFFDDYSYFLQRSIQIFIHRRFNVNATIVRCNKPTDSWYSLGNDNLHLEIAEKKFIGPHYPVTVITPHNTLKIKFNTGQSYSAIIKFDVVQNLNMTYHPQMTENAMHFPWGDFLVTCFQIKVDVKARLSFGFMKCVACNVLVYDGPNERLPIILKINDTRKTQRVVGSTFQVYVVITEDDYKQKSHMTFAPVYIKTSVFNLSMNGRHETSFDNHTQCYGHSFAARLCVYTFHTAHGEKMRFTLTDLNFKGRYQGGSFAAGVFVFNHFGENLVKLMKFNSDLPLLDSTDFEIIGTIIHVAIFVYSDFASLSLKFSMSKTSCNMLLVSNIYVSYSGYITPVNDTTHVFYVNKPSKDLPAYDNCYQLQFLWLEYQIIIIFPRNTPVLMTINGFGFHNNGYDPCSTFIKTLTGKYHINNSKGEYRDRQTFVASIKYMKLSNCELNTYLQILIKWLACKLPCRHLQLERKCNPGNAPEMMWHDSDNATCDICEKNYFCDSVLLKNNISISIGLKPNICLSVELFIASRYRHKSPDMWLSLNHNMISRIPGFVGWINTWVSSERCILEIPKEAVHAGGFFSKQTTLDEVKAAYWGDVLYYRLSSFRLVTWEKAARHCYDIGAFLLTIHSLAEYQFIKEAFLQSHDTSVLYVGLKRQVLQVISLNKIHLFYWDFTGTWYVDILVCIYSLQNYDRSIS